MLNVPNPLVEPKVERRRVTVLGRFHRFLTDGMAGKRIGVLYGGAGSGKSFSVGQHLVRMFATYDNLDIMVVRKTRPSLRLTCWPMVRSILRDWGVPHELNLSNLDITRGGSVMHFRGLDDPEKIKSAEFNQVWGEEATELTHDDYLQLDLRLRRPHPQVPQQMFLTFNPIDANHWAITELVNGNRPEVAVMHSTYKDNPFLPEVYVKTLQDLEFRDENFYRVYTLGLPGVLKHIIYTNWETVDEPAWPLFVRERPPDYYGLDWGFNDPTVLIGVWREERTFYLKEMLYRTHITTADLIEWMNRHGVNSTSPMACDPSRPDQIEELHRAGFNAHPADAHRIGDGIDFVRANRLVISPESVNLLKEIRGYKWREDKNKTPLDVPVDYMDHAMDAMRYGIYTFRPKGSDIKNVDISQGGGFLQQMDWW